MTTLRTAVVAALLSLVCLAATLNGAAGAAARTPQIFTGQAFDTCAAPSLTSLRAWHTASPYRALGIYIGGNNRGCAQPLLTASWTRSATAIGWRLLPLYVGSQAPCLPAKSRTARISAARALAQGASEGKDAVKDASALALTPGSPLYLDMESYDRGSSCTLAVLQYTAAWSRAVRAAGYLAGFYSSADTGIADIASAALKRSARAAATDLPDVLWYARWDNRASTDGYRALSGSLWTGHRRVHQFVGNTRETHGGVTMNIDRNAVDAPVALVH
ncbi:DUF1906 domain-containing protein [Streptacidiphilus sp. N1-12]|uniref:DUF1906 domain-containing protein n=2 Tax=Streptacidiphilus alkalitolerans TaxID=3342712 RepID=A0ABV6VB37_9ACTN